MKKFLIIIILNLICVNSAQSTMTVGKYLNDKNSEYSPIVSALKNYVHAAGTAIFWNTVVSNAYNQKTFCPPSNWSPSLNDFINYIDSEIIYAKKNGKYKDSDKVAFYMATYLYRVFPCK